MAAWGAAGLTLAVLGAGAMITVRTLRGQPAAASTTYTSPSDAQTRPLRTPFPAHTADVNCGGRRTSIPMHDLVAAAGPMTSIAAGSDVPGDLAKSKRLSVRVSFPGGVVGHHVFVDVDDDRSTGMWTYQSPVSASGWDLMVDPTGAVFRHTGASAEWSFVPGGVAGFSRSTSASAVDLCFSTATLGARVRIAVMAGDVWLPAAFLPGAAYPVPPTGSEAPVPSSMTRLAIHYGAQPWRADGCRDTACAARVFGSFGHVVFGAGLENGNHPSHDRATDLIGRIRRDHPGTEVWGYISMIGPAAGADGRRPEIYTPQRIVEQARAWQAMGATGVFLDEADLCERCADGLSLTRDRFARVVRGIHGLGLPVFVNAYAPFDVLGPSGGIPTPLGAGDGARPADMYLIENPTAVSGGHREGVDAAASKAKLAVASRLRAATGVRMAAIDTAAGPVSAGDPAFAAAWDAAARAGLDAYGFTNPSYSAVPEHEANLLVAQAPSGATVPPGQGAAAEGLAPVQVAAAPDAP